MTTFNVLKEYKKEFRISDISLSFIESFDDHMREINGNSPGGRNPKHKNLRTVILDIQKHNIQANNPYKWFKIQMGGKKVGIISHVEGLRERIKTQIQVKRIDNSRSEITTVRTL